MLLKPALSLFITFETHIIQTRIRFLIKTEFGFSKPEFGVSKHTLLYENPHCLKPTLQLKHNPHASFAKPASVILKDTLSKPTL